MRPTLGIFGVLDGLPSHGDSALNQDLTGSSPTAISLGAPAEFLLRLRDHVEKASGVVHPGTAPGKEKATPHLVPWTLCRPRSELLQGSSHFFLELLVGDLATTLADHPPVLGKKPAIAKR